MLTPTSASFACDQVAVCLLSICTAVAVVWSIVKSWRWTQTITGDAASRQEAPSSVLAQKLEAEGDFTGAMKVLLSLHHARDSQAVILAHELSRRHPDAFEVKGCPVLSQRNEREAAGQNVVADGVTTTPAAAASQMWETATTAARSSIDSVAVGVEMKAGKPTAGGQQQQPKQKEGETPWERGWQGPAGFTPPSSRTTTGGDAEPGAAAAQSAGNVSIKYAVELRNFTIVQLNAFNGGLLRAAPSKRGGTTAAVRKPRPIYIALRGRVYDASAGRDLYGPGGKYSEFAGHDISRRVARGVTGQQRPSGNGDGDLDDLSLEALDRFENMTLTGWEDTFAARGYSILGRVVAPPSPRLLSREELRAFDGRGELIARKEEADGGRSSSPLTMPTGYAVPSIYMGVKDKVFDVSFGGSEFYVEGGAYECLAGRDASRVLAKMSMTPADIEGRLDYGCLTDRETKNLDDWVDKLGEGGKGYPVVGWMELN